MDPKHKGAMSEMKACAWLLEHGYEVFRNVSQHGTIDIIARRPETGQILLLDVKTLTKKTVAGHDYLIAGKLSPEQVEQGVKSLNVSKDKCFIEHTDKYVYKA